MKNRAIKLVFPLLAVLILTPAAITGICSSYALVRQKTAEGYVAGVFNQTSHLYSEPTRFTFSFAPNDEYLEKQWALVKVRAFDAWQITSGKPNVLIAVLDTGIDQAHIDLADKVRANINFTQSPKVDDVYGHGTHVAGIIGAIANNGIGIAGMAHKCSLMNVKVVDDRGRCNAETVAEGIVWAVDHVAKVINMSLTLAKPAQVLENAVNYAWGKGAVLVCAAGNGGGSNPVYPAYYTSCLSVTSINKDDLLGQLANHGDWVDVAAPGVNIYSTLPHNGFGYESGTSTATAYVSGVAGLLFSVVSDTNGNGLLNDEVRNAIESSCDEMESLVVTKKRINALRAIRQVLSPSPQLH